MKGNDNSIEYFKGGIEIIGDRGPAELVEIPSRAKVFREVEVSKWLYMQYCKHSMLQASGEISG